MAKPAAPTKPAPKSAPKPKPGASTTTGPGARASANGAAAPPPPSSSSTAPRPLTKGEVLDRTAKDTMLSRKQVASVFESLANMARLQLGRKGPGVFALHGIVKFKMVRKPAVKAKQGINPFTKEPMTFKARPARNVVKAIPLKALKDMG